MVLSSNKRNPADGASRGLNAGRVHSGSFWFEGTVFLQKNQNSWPCVKGVEVETVLTDDPELIVEAKSYAAFVHKGIIGDLKESISSWPKLKRITALVNKN